ncbi:hypothetical protein NPX99_04155 [Bartonella sp. 220]|uniref:hypothetical protein n=1 Tax=Bartonella sp. 220B TaxID=2967260 RepID=UPI0022A9F469|nr:hypothetical protein [Bartonella sp. 220B]MCZ2158472.1 hypothetical protein [Bartonella sp. 220B]
MSTAEDTCDKIGHESLISYIWKSKLWIVQLFLQRFSVKCCHYRLSVYGEVIKMMGDVKAVPLIDDDQAD